MSSRGWPNDKRVVTVRAKHLSDIELSVHGHDGPATLAVPHDRGWTEFTGTAAIHATGVLIAGANRYGAAPRRCAGRGAADRERGRRERLPLRGVDAQRLARRQESSRSSITIADSARCTCRRTERLALEMAVHEESERRAMEGELAVLEAAWRDAEQIAQICDDDLTPPKLYE